MAGDPKISSGTTATGEDLVIPRVFDAPREVVFKAWTEPEHFVRWWGPKGFTTPHCTIDLRPGGVIHFCMRSPEGQEIWCKGVYREIAAPERIVVTDFFSDEKGNLVPAARYGLSPDWPLETLMTVTLEDLGGKTKMTLRQTIGFPPAADARGLIRAGRNRSTASPNTLPINRAKPIPATDR